MCTKNLYYAYTYLTSRFVVNTVNFFFTMDTEESLPTDSEKENANIPEIEQLEDEFELRDRPDKEISHWWKTLILISLFITAVSGLCSSIAIGDLLAAFQNKCILYAKISLINMDDDDFDGKTLFDKNISEDGWGDIYDCEFCEFASLFSVVFSGMMFAMFLQFGRGGITAKGGRRAWEFVWLALLITIIFFIIGTVIFAKTIGGFAFFCDYIIRDSHSPEHVKSCQQVFGYHFYWNPYQTDLYLEYILAHIGVCFTFVGWFASLVILIFRIILGVDFVVYRKRTFAITKDEKIQDKKKKVRFLVGSKSSKEKEASLKNLNSNNTKYESLSTQSSTSSESLDDDSYSDSEETSFITVALEMERKKFI